MLNLLNPPAVASPSARTFIILAQEFLGRDGYVKLIWDLRDAEYSGPVASAGAYPVATLRNQPADGKVVAISKGAINHEAAKAKEAKA